MSQFRMRYAIAGIMLFPMAWASHAQSNTPQGAWLMQNYRFTGPPAPREVRPIDAALVEIRGMQSTLRNLMSRARFDGDYETALAAAAQIVANAQLIGAIAERAQAPQDAPVAKPAAEEAQSTAPIVVIALKDKSINAAKTYWVDGRMLNYITLQGAHVIVKLDLVDKGLSGQLNFQRNVEFHLPE